MSNVACKMRFAIAEAVVRKLWAQDLLSDDELEAVLEKTKQKIFANAA